MEESQSKRSLGLDDLLVLNGLLLEREFDEGRAAKLIQKPDEEARRVLMRLIEAGLVEARGEKMARRYVFSGRTVRRLGIEPTDSKAGGFDPQQQERRILEYVKEHGQISRREAADLLQLSSLQARYLLKKLVTGGLLASRGKGRATVYVRWSKKSDKSKKKSDKSKSVRLSSNAKTRKSPKRKKA